MERGQNLIEVEHPDDLFVVLRYNVLHVIQTAVQIEFFRVETNVSDRVFKRTAAQNAGGFQHTRSPGGIVVTARNG